MAGAAYTFWKIGNEAIKGSAGDPYAVHWDDIEAATIRASICENHQDPQSVRDAILKYSPVSVLSSKQARIEKIIESEVRRLADIELKNDNLMCVT